MDAEVKRTYDQFCEDIQDIYSELKEGKRGLEITELDSHDSGVIKKVIERNNRLRLNSSLSHNTH
ncbi:hypothetical protein COU57_00355 [Candidatus Pacearchaeota archaeon CG10_big_fil_rev_8_21_14_0_10_32_14]|nr:MAG: hypothetical protein COU57_00355 [Candidatus Pacearchaeota archaeon CG10_big_fil_rev_8_21_14_0_10_32_14]